MYGMSTLLVYNTVLNTIAYFQLELKNYRPSFVINFGINSLVVILVFLSIFRGHHVKFKIKNNYGK